MVNSRIGPLTTEKFLFNVCNALLQGGVRTALFMVVYWFILPIFPSGAVPASYFDLFYIYVLIAVIPTSIAYIFSGTVLRYCIMSAKDLVLVIFFVNLLKEQKVTTRILVGDVTVSVTIDLLIPTAMIITIYLVNFGKSLLEAVNFMSESSEKPVEAI